MSTYGMRGGRTARAREVFWDPPLRASESGSLVRSGWKRREWGGEGPWRAGGAQRPVRKHQAGGRGLQLG